MKRFGLTLLAGAAALTFAAAPASATPTGGANSGCGAYCPSGVGEPSGNGASVWNNGNRPAAGTVGNADSKFPPGQAPDGTDNNNGYECDGNQGIGQTNPAHTGCRVS